MFRKKVVWLKSLEFEIKNEVSSCAALPPSFHFLLHFIPVDEPVDKPGDKSGDRKVETEKGQSSLNGPIGKKAKILS